MTSEEEPQPAAVKEEEAQETKEEEATEGEGEKSETKEVKEDVVVKSETSVKEEEEEKKEDDDVLKSVTERLKFFFSDANIRQDYFIRKFLMVDDEGKNADSGDGDGSIPVEVLLRFNTIKQHTSDPEIIIKVVKTMMSEKLSLLDDDKAIARVKPFTEKLLDENIPVSLYVKNLPTKDVELDNGKKIKQYAVTIDEIRELFESYGEISLVKLRYKMSAHSNDDDHTDDIKAEDQQSSSANKRKPRRKYPLGACLVEFENLEALEKAAADVLTSKGGEKVEPKRKLELGGTTLKVELLKDYVDKIQNRKRERDHGQDDDNNNKDGDEEANKFTIEWKPGCVISLKGLPESCDREAILDTAVKACDLGAAEAKEKKTIYVDYSRGQKDGALRFQDPELASKMLAKFKEGSVKIAGSVIEEAKLLEGDEEKHYWEGFIEFKRRQIRHRNEERSMKHKNKKRRRRV